MGKIKNGILGPVQGKVGTVVGATWNGIGYVRTQPLSYTDAKTEDQVSQRAAFKEVTEFVQPLRNFLKVAYKRVDKNSSAYNTATKYILKNAVVKEDDDARIDYSKVLVASGTLPTLNDASATYSTGKLTLTWGDESGQNLHFCYADDKIMPLVYNVDKSQVTFMTSQFKREDKQAEITMPSGWQGDKVVVYVATADSKNREASNSIYLGEFTVD